MEKVVYIILLTVLVLQYLYPTYTISGDSMYPTIKHKDKVILAKQKKLEQSDIIVFKVNDGDFYVKRVIAKGGDIIQFTEEGIVVNNEYLTETYLTEEDNYDLLQDYRNLNNVEIKIPQGQYYVLGDNRGNSLDSRDIGSIKKEDVIGKVILRY